MRLFSLFLVGLSAALANASVIVAEADLPTCALLCLETEILASNCSLTDTECQCTNTALTAAITTCVTANCTVKESLTTKAYTENNCGAPVRNLTIVNVLVEAIGFGFAGTAFIIRMASKWTGAGGKYGMDDYIMLLVMVIAIPCVAIGCELAKWGLGKDIWMLESVYNFAHYLVIEEILYLVSLPLIKTSILFFYLRIFPEKRIRYMVFASMFLCVGYGIAFVLVSVFQCSPVSGAWTEWDGTFTGHCNNINLQGWTSAAFNIILDLIVIILPLPELWKMKMSATKKMHIMVMFSVGFAITVVSIVRLTTLVQFGGTSNTSYDYVLCIAVSSIERNVGIVCACMPAMRALFKQQFPNGWASTRKGTEATAKLSSSNKRSKSEIEKVIASQHSNKPKDKDVDDFIPLVDWESTDHGQSGIPGSKGDFTTEIRANGSKN